MALAPREIPGRDSQRRSGRALIARNVVGIFLQFNQMILFHLDRQIRISIQSTFCLVFYTMYSLYQLATIWN
jgi:hypothetical protein